tara:strand:- start:2215 stop:4026 length:1812 start_codon:yes stop_codon:yes gene_type:complete
MATVNFNLPSPYESEMADIARRQKMAELMQQQAFQPAETFSFNGIQARTSPLTGIAKALQGYMAVKTQKDLIQEQKALGEKEKADATDYFINMNRVPVDAGALQGETRDPLAAQQITYRPRTDAEMQAYLAKGLSNRYVAPLAQQELLRMQTNQRFLGGVTPAPAAAPAAAPSAAPVSDGSVSQEKVIAAQPGIDQSGQMTRTGGGQALARMLRYGDPVLGQTQEQYLLRGVEGQKDYQEALLKYNMEVNKATELMKNLRAAGVREGSPQWNAALTEVATQGGIWTLGAKGERTLNPGFLAGSQALKTMEEQVKAGFDLVEVPVPGGTQKMPRAQAIEILRANAQRFMPSPATPVAAPSAAPVVAPTAAAQGAAPNVAPNVVRPAVVGGGQPAMGRGGVGFTSSDKSQQIGSETTAKLNAEKFAKDTEKFNTLYQTSNSMLQNLDLLDQLFSDPNVASGAAADTISSLKGLADSFGIKTTGLSAENVIASITGKMALQAKSEGGQNLMPGAMAASELTFLRNLVPQLTQSKEGRLLLSQVNRAMATRDMQLSEMAGRYADQYGGLNAGFYRQARQFYKENPLFSPEKLEAMNEFAKRLARGGR